MRSQQGASDRLRSGKVRGEQKGPGNQSQHKKTTESDYHRNEAPTACSPQ
jgi:hypothetical protein